MTRIRAALAVALIACAAFAACGRAKEPPPVETETPPPSPAPAMTDSTIPMQDGMRPGSMSAGTKAAAESAALGAMRDSAFGPKFAVDSTGKVIPIKPPE